MARRRLDTELVRRGLCPTRQAAREAVAAGLVTVGGAPALKPARMVDPGEALVVAGPPRRFVGRGGDKLDAALATFGIDVDGRRAVDVGASTGGFTDCLLQRGAREVVALDVGHGQLDHRLRQDPRVRVVERTNVRHLAPPDGDERRRALTGPSAEVVVADLSFISLRVVADALLALAAPGADVVVLVKPQFEAGRAEVSRGQGVIADPEVWHRTLCEVIAALAERGACIMGLMVSPLRGGEGNVEFLVHLRPPPAPAGASTETDQLVRAAVDDAVALTAERAT